MSYSRTPSPAEVEAFFESIEARDERRAEKLGTYSLHALRLQQGRRREENPEFLRTRPGKILESGVVYLQDRMSRLTEPLTEQFSRDFRIPLQHSSYRRYKRAGDRNNSTESIEQALRDGDNTRHDRQIEHIADGAQRGARQKYNLSVLRRFALRSVLTSAEENLPIIPEAASYAGNALVDFAEGLEPLPHSWLNYPFCRDLDKQIEHVGTYAQTDPAVLLENPAVLTLVGKEQRKRISFWALRYELAVEVDGYERISEDEMTLRDELRREIINFSFDETNLPPIY